MARSSNAVRTRQNTRRRRLRANEVDYALILRAIKELEDWFVEQEDGHGAKQGRHDPDYPNYQTSATQHRPKARAE